jgi:hypothetical protein
MADMAMTLTKVLVPGPLLRLTVGVLTGTTLEATTGAATTGRVATTQPLLVVNQLR